MAIVKLADLIGQTEAASFLRGLIARRRFANAYLFHGPAGVGKGTAALAFARALLCERGAGRPDAEAARPNAAPGLFDTAGPAAKTPAAPLDDACGVCAACVKTGDLAHPDMKFLFPVSGEERELDQTIGETLESMRQDPLFVFQYDKFASIRLSLTRDLLREMGYRPFEAIRRVVVVRDADRMREDQYSALLKAIEEPGLTVWVLTTPRLQRLPATIRSRTQRVRFAPLPEGTIATFLEQRAKVSRPAARLLAAVSGGSLARALAMRGEDPKIMRDQALALLEPALRQDAFGLWKAVQGYTKFGRAGREALRTLIEFHELWLRDLLRARYGGSEAVLVHADRETEIRRQAERIDGREVRRRLMVLEEVLRSIEGNVAPDLALFSGLARVAGQRLGEDGWPAHLVDRWDY